jgi:hypothetical protein
MCSVFLERFGFGHPPRPSLIRAVRRVARKKLQLRVEILGVGTGLLEIIQRPLIHYLLVLVVNFVEYSSSPVIV